MELNQHFPYWNIFEVSPKKPSIAYTKPFSGPQAASAADLDADRAQRAIGAGYHVGSIFGHPLVFFHQH